MISSELPEVLGMSDRILVMRAGRDRRPSFDAPRGATEERVLSAALGAGLAEPAARGSRTRDASVGTLIGLLLLVRCCCGS